MHDDSKCPRTSIDFFHRSLWNSSFPMLFILSPYFLNPYFYYLYSFLILHYSQYRHLLLFSHQAIASFFRSLRSPPPWPVLAKHSIAYMLCPDWLFLATHHTCSFLNVFLIMPPSYLKPLFGFPIVQNQLTSLQTLCVLSSSLEPYFLKYCPTISLVQTKGRFWSPSPQAYFCMQQDFASVIPPGNLLYDKPSTLFFHQPVLQMLVPVLQMLGLL